MLAKNVNIWHNLTMKRSISRKLEEWQNKKGRKPLVIKGARQVGKTYILKEFANKCFSNTHYLNFEKDKQAAKIFEEELVPSKILEKLSFYLGAEISKDNDILIFDEVQNVPKALTSLKYFHEEMPELAICAAGSLLGLCLPEESFPVGKVEFMNMFPMSFEEFLLGVGDIKSYKVLQNVGLDNTIPDIVHEHLWEQLKIYFVVGGLPEIVSIYSANQDNLFSALKNVREKQADLILAYNADMAKHSGKQNAMHLERVWRNIPAQLAKEQDGLAPKFKFKGVVPGINRYSGLVGVIDWLVATGLIIKISIINNVKLPFSAYVSENNFKLYVFDVGILGALSDLSPSTILEYDYGSYKGYFAENFVAQEFLYSGDSKLYCWRQRTSEIEFLRDIEGKVLPIEVKSGWISQSKSLNVFDTMYTPDYKTVISARNFYIDKKKRIYKYPLYLASRFPLS